MTWQTATTPSTLTPTYETCSPLVSRKNSLVTGSRCSPLQEEVHQQQRETIIRFQLENEVGSAKAELMNNDLVAAVATVSGEPTEKTDGTGSGTNKLGQLYFKVR